MSFTSLGDFAPEGVATASLEIQQIFHDLIRADGRGDSVPLVRAWLESGGDPNLVANFRNSWDHDEDYSILSMAVELGHVETVRLLLESGARVEDKNLGRAQWCNAGERKTLAIVKLLIGAGADVNKPEGGGEWDACQSPLMKAINYHRFDVARYLLSQGADVNYVDPTDEFRPDALSWARQHAKGKEMTDGDWYYDHVIEFCRFLELVVAAGGWKPYVRAPRVSLVVLRRLCEKDRARPPSELARLFALDKFIFWRVLSFWRTDRDLPHHITTRDTTAPP